MSQTIITAVGSGTYNIPVGCTQIIVDVWSGGGGASSQNGGTSGTGSACSRKTYNVSYPQSFSYNNAAGGDVDQNGGVSWFSAIGTQKADPGKAGSNGTSVSGGQASASIGDTKYSGGAVIEANLGGSGAAGPAGNGSSPSGASGATGGPGDATDSQTGGTGGDFDDTDTYGGYPGAQPGAGAGTAFSGGASGVAVGGNGMIVITELYGAAATQPPEDAWDWSEPLLDNEDFDYRFESSPLVVIVAPPVQQDEWDYGETLDNEWSDDPQIGPNAVAPSPALVEDGWNHFEEECDDEWQEEQQPVGLAAVIVVTPVPEDPWDHQDDCEDDIWLSGTGDTIGAAAVVPPVSFFTTDIFEM